MNQGENLSRALSGPVCTNLRNCFPSRFFTLFWLFPLSENKPFWNRKAKIEKMPDLDEETDSRNDSEEHMWTRVDERPTGEELDEQRNRMVSTTLKQCRETAIWVILYDIANFWPISRTMINLAIQFLDWKWHTHIKFYTGVGPVGCQSNRTILPNSGIAVTNRKIRKTYRGVQR